jgi:transglutaminase-like putative cysteine protease
MQREQTACERPHGELHMADPMAPYLAPTRFVDSDAAGIVALANEVVGGTSDEVERACRLYYAVRDGIRYTAYDLDLRAEALRGSHVLASGEGWCVSKSVLLAALCRAVGIPCRLGYANVRNHMATAKLLEFLGTDVFYYHGYNEIFLRGRWVKATTAFNRTLCDKARIAPLEFDGVHDSIYHPFDLGGHRYMEYLHEYAPAADVPYGDMIAKFSEVYPRMFQAETSRQIAGDFEAEVQQEAGGQDLLADRPGLP